MLSYSYSRKQGSERPCSLSAAESTHRNTKTTYIVEYSVWCYRHKVHKNPEK